MVAHRDSNTQSSTADAPLDRVLSKLEGVRPLGGDINVVWDNGANKIFRL